MRTAHRFSGPGKAYEGLTKVSSGGPVWTGEVRLVPEMLEAPLRWRKPQRIFVNSMSDLFHEGLDDWDISRVFGVMAACPQHTFLILTKRQARMREFVSRGLTGDITCAYEEDGRRELRETVATYAPPGSLLPEDPVWPLPNVQLGVSLEGR